MNPLSGGHKNRSPVKGGLEECREHGASDLLRSFDDFLEADRSGDEHDDVEHDQGGAVSEKMA
jgi:hypothetical protein